MEGLLAFVLAAIALAGSPGPATLSLAATGAAFGARRGLGYMTGESTEQRRQPSVGGGVFLSLVNPKGYAAMAALFSGFVLVRERIELDVAAKVTVLAAIIIAVNLAWLIAGAGLTRYFREPRTNRVINVAFAVLLVASVAFALPELMH